MADEPKVQANIEDDVQINQAMKGKKKKKKVKKAPAAAAEFKVEVEEEAAKPSKAAEPAEEEPKVEAAQPEEDDGEDIQVDFSKKKKKKKKAPGAQKQNEDEIPSKKGKAQEQKGFNWNQEGRKQYVFSDLLDRIETIMLEKASRTEEESMDQKGELPISRFVSTKTTIVNFQALCQQLDRKPEHLLNFIKSEMDVEGNLGAENNALFTGRHKNPVINGIYKKYVEQYVQCFGCKSLKTSIKKDPSTRLFNLQCKVCDATRTMQDIKKSYHTLKRGERRRERQK